MKLLVSYLNKLPENTRSLILTCIYGVSAGLAAVAFHVGIHFFFESTYHHFEGYSVQDFAISSFLIIMPTSLMAGWLMWRFGRETAGSGIPQLKAAFWKDFGYVPGRVAVVKFFAGVLSVGGGTSLGREGPTVQLAGALSSHISGYLGVAKQKRRAAAAAGAAAGLAAAFNTPIAAVFFVLEEIVENMNARIFGSVILASVIGAFTAHAFLGDQPAFNLPSISEPSVQVFLLVPLVAAVAAFVGVFFQYLTLALRQWVKKLKHIPLWLKPSAGALCTWVLGVAVFAGTGSMGVFGLGYADLSYALTQADNQVVWQLAGVLLVTKFLATVLSYGWGGCGGIFAPLLFLGSMAAIAMNGVFASLGIPLSKDDYVVLAVVGMSSCLGAVVRAPMTSILIVFEMTHEFALVPALMLGTLVSQTIGRRFLDANFYQQILDQDGHKLQHIIPPRDLRSWQQYPVSAIASVTPVMAESMAPDYLEDLIDEHPYHRFPLYQDGELKGVLGREEIQRALVNKRKPAIMTVPTCLRDDTIEDIQMQLIESETGVVVLLDKKGGTPVGVISLHDLLRAEAKFAKQM